MQGHWCRTDLVIIHRNHPIHVPIAQLEGLLADGLDGGAVGEEPDVVQNDGLARFERRRHAGRVLGLDTVHFNVGPHLFHVGRDAGQQPATAAAAKDRVQPSPVALP